MINEKLEVKILDHDENNWKSIYRATLNTIGKDTINSPSEVWKKRILMSEHSPIRKLRIGATFRNLFSWVSVHFVRHKIGVEHFVKTQRTDRTGVDRGSSPQNALVNHEMDLNAQAIINISRKRLCHCASPETTEAWKEFVKELHLYEPELASMCVKECVYRNGLCPEFKTCGYNKTPQFALELKNYTEIAQNQISPMTDVRLNMKLVARMNEMETELNKLKEETKND